MFYLAVEVKFFGAAAQPELYSWVVEDPCTLSEEDVGGTLRRLAERSCHLDSGSYRHLMEVLGDYLGSPSDEFRADCLAYSGRLMAPNALLYLEDVRTSPPSGTTLPPELEGLLNTIAIRGLDDQRMIVASWSYELFAKERWDKTLDETADEFIAIMVPDGSETSQ